MCPTPDPRRKYSAQAARSAAARRRAHHPRGGHRAHCPPRYVSQDRRPRHQRECPLLRLGARHRSRPRPPARARLRPSSQWQRSIIGLTGEIAARRVSRSASDGSPQRDDVALRPQRASSRARPARATPRADPALVAATSGPDLGCPAIAASSSRTRRASSERIRPTVTWRAVAGARNAARRRLGLADQPHRRRIQLLGGRGRRRPARWRKNSRMPSSPPSAGRRPRPTPTAARCSTGGPALTLRSSNTATK